ncbi:MAG TPA: caspase family protein [Xanthobacteraceae bacterium]
MRLVAAFACAVMLTCLGSLPGHAEKRVALVIGNSQYTNQSNKLPNPQNDAHDLAEVLRVLGFEVLQTIDADKRGFDLALQQFARLATDADAALFFYAGHAMQYQGKNYLMPVDAELQDEIGLAYQMVKLEDVQFAMNRAKGVKIMILDACRNNPVAERFVRSVLTRDFGSARGLARVDKTEGMVVAYATAANEVAEDGNSRNSPYTSALLKRLQEAGLEVEVMFRRVAQDVNAQTNGRQRPEILVSLLSEYYLNQLDRLAWEKIKDSDDPAAFRAFVKQFPSSGLAVNAGYRLDIIALAARAKEENVRARQEVARLTEERLAHERAELERIERERAKRESPVTEPASSGPSVDEVTWGVIKDTKDADELRRFIQQFPESARRQQAEARIGTLAADQAAKPVPPSPEEVAWNLVKDSKDPDQLRRFAVQFPTSRRRGEAEQRMAALAAEAAKTAALLDRREMARSLQQELKRVGCFEGALDGEFSDTTRAALRNFAKLAGLSVPDELSPDALKAVHGAEKRVCPLICQPGERVEGDRCIRVTCRSGQILKNGTCVAEGGTEPQKRAPPNPAPSRPTPAPAPKGNGKCFSFQGRQFCE